MMDSSIKDQTPHSHQLNYGQRAALAWIGRHRRRWIVLAISIAIAIPLIQYRKPLQQRATLLHRFNQAARYTMPESAELVVTDAEKIPHLLATNPDYVQFGTALSADSKQTPVWTPEYAAVYIPRAFRRLAEVDPRLSVLKNNSPWRTLNSAIAFMGTRTRPDGAERLIILRGNDNGLVGGDSFGPAHVVILPLPRILDPLPAQPPISDRGDYFMIFTGNESLLECQLFRAVADANNPTHLVLYYRDSEMRPVGSVDAFLKDDDTLLFKPQQDSRIKSIRWLSNLQIKI